MKTLRMGSWAGLMVLGLLVMSQDALARGRGRGPGPGMGGMGEGFGPGCGRMGGLAALDLNDGQRQQLADLRATQLERTAPLRADLDARRAELRALWTADAPDRQAILAKHAEMDGLRQKLREARVDHRLEMLRVLTPEQRAKMGAAGFGPGRDFGKRGMGRHRW